MPYHYPDRNTYYRAQRAEQARIDRVHAGYQRYKNSLEKSNRISLKSSDMNLYAKLGILAVKDMGYRWSLLGFVFLFMVICSMFSHASDANLVFSFNTLLSAIRDIPTIELVDFRFSDNWMALSDSMFSKLALFVLEVSENIVSIEAFEFLAEPLLQLLASIYDAQAFVGELVQFVSVPLDFLNYIVASFIQLLRFITYFVHRFFVVPFLPS